MPSDAVVALFTADPCRGEQLSSYWRNDAYTPSTMDGEVDDPLSVPATAVRSPQQPLGTRAGTAVVVGAAGEVGEGVVSVLLAAGWRVLALSRDPVRLQTLQARVTLDRGRLVPVVAEMDDEAGWRRTARDLAQHAAAPDLVVASLGGWWIGPETLQVGLPVWDRVLADGLGAHLLAARALLPPMRAAGRGAYVMVNGAAALSPVPGSSPVSVSAAAQLMLARVLAREVAPVRVSSLVVMTPVRSRSRPDGPPGWLTAQDVGHAVLQLPRDPAADGAAVEPVVLLGQE